MKEYYPFKISIIEAGEAKTKEVLLPTSAEGLKPTKLFKLIDIFSDTAEDDVDLFDYDVKYVSAWLDLSPALIREYVAAKTLKEVISITSWFPEYYSKLDSIEAPKKVNLLGNVIDVQSCYDNLTVGTLELLNKVNLSDNVLDVLYSCLRVPEQSSGTYLTVLPKTDAIAELNKLPASTVYALLSFFLNHLKNKVKHGNHSNLLKHLLRLLLMKKNLINLGL